MLRIANINRGITAEKRGLVPLDRVPNSRFPPSMFYFRSPEHVGKILACFRLLTGIPAGTC